MKTATIDEIREADQPTDYTRSVVSETPVATEKG